MIYGTIDFILQGDAKSNIEYGARVLFEESEEELKFKLYQAYVVCPCPTTLSYYI